MCICICVYVCKHISVSLKHATFISCSVQFICSVVSDSLWPGEPQQARSPCPSPTPGVYSNSCPSSQWCHPTISSSVIPFSPCPQSFLVSGSFQMSQHFTSGGQSIGVSASKSVLPMNTQDWSPSEWTGWISLQSNGLSRVFPNTTVQKHQFFFFFNFYFYFILLYNTVLVLPYIDMNPPRVYMHSKASILWCSAFFTVQL